MTRALRSVSSEKGRDPRDFAIIAYGGSGPVHAGGLADDLGVTTDRRAAGGRAVQRRRPALRAARVPRGALVPPRRRRGRPGGDHGAARRDGGAARRARSRGASEPTWARTADLRYGGQSWEIEVELPDGPVDRELLAGLRARFEDEHEVLYGVRGQPGSPVEVRAVRLAALGASAATLSFDVADALVAGPRRDAPHVARRRGEGRARAGPGLDRRATPVPGPLLVDEYDTTVVVPDGWSVRRHLETGTLVLEKEAAHDSGARRRHPIP